MGVQAQRRGWLRPLRALQPEHSTPRSRPSASPGGAKPTSASGPVLRLIALNLALLATVVVVPFPHHVLSQYPLEPLAYALYAAALGAVLVMDSAMCVYASRAALFRTPWPAAALRAELLRGLIPISVFNLSVPLAFVLVELC